MTERPARPTQDEILAFLQQAGRGALNERMGIEIVAADLDRIVGTMPVEGNTQPYGILHGGASAVLAETLGSVGAALNAPPDRYPVGIELSCSHHSSATSGTITGTARPIRTGRSLSTWEIVIEDEAGRRVCTARLSCMLLERS